MKCAVAIVLALVGLSIANPTPLGLGLTTLAHAQPGVYTSSVINHGYSIPRVVVTAPVVAPLIRTVYTSPIVTPILNAHPHGLYH